MYKYLKPNLIFHERLIDNAAIKYLGLQSTKTKLQKLYKNYFHPRLLQRQNFYQIVCQERQKTITQKNLISMRDDSLKAWNKTKKLLFKEVERYFIKSKLIDSWNFTGDCFKISKKALDIYRKKESQSKLSTFISWEHERESVSSVVPLGYIQHLASEKLKKIRTFFLETLKQKQVCSFTAFLKCYCSYLLISEKAYLAINLR
ncbi:MAG: hypothetical protein AAFR83_13325 [Cyanobacteria bacterium J06629_18]